jgi:hypothetical protein
MKDLQRNLWKRQSKYMPTGIDIPPWILSTRSDGLHVSPYLHDIAGLRLMGLCSLLLPHVALLLVRVLFLLGLPVCGLPPTSPAVEPADSL